MDPSAKKVWNTLWDNVTYSEWTSAFAKGSRAESDWKKGSKIIFLNTRNNGMVSRIANVIPNEFMSFQHLGSIKNGVEVINSPEDKAWAWLHENYKLKPVNGKTDLTVELETKGLPKQMLDYFMETFPKALEKLKTLAEKK